MNYKLISTVAIIVIFVGIFTVFITVANAKGLFCPKTQNILVTLKNDADIDKSKAAISKIPKIKIIKIQDRNKEWSRYVNKMDLLPKMDNPFKNEFTIKTKKNANADEIYNKIKEMSFVEEVKFATDEECAGRKK